MSTLRAIRRAVALIAITGALLPIFLMARHWAADRGRPIVGLWFRMATRIVGLSVEVQGLPDGALIVANHVSYLDILAIGAQRDVTFVAKGDVARWPVIGSLARIAGTIFAERARRDAPVQVATIDQALTAGHTIVLFPEGTSSPGTDVLTFKSALFQVAVDRARIAELKIQPLSIAYVRDANGRPLADDERRIHPWFGDDSLLPHLWTVLGHRGATVDIAFHRSLTVRPDTTRKALAEQCQRATARGVSHLRQSAADPAAWNRETTAWIEALDRPVWSSID